MTIVSLMMLSFLFIIMMGVAGVRLLDASKKASQANEAYNYLVVMEEMGIAVSRARSLGRNNIDCAPVAVPCPAGTVAVTVASPAIPTYCQVPQSAGPAVGVNQYSLCVPDRDGDAVAEASDFCVSIDGFNYCLNSSAGVFFGLQQTGDATATSAYSGRPAPYAAVAGASTQLTDGSALAPRNNMETWSPAVVWASNNEVYSTACDDYVTAPDKYWLGCNNVGDPYMEFWEMRMCRPSPNGAALNACAAADMALQRIVLYFENNVR